MTTRLQVHYTKKRDVADVAARIETIGGIENGRLWYLAHDDAIDLIAKGTHSFFVVVSGREANVIVQEFDGAAFLKTTADDYAPKSLLALPSFPA